MLSCVCRPVNSSLSKPPLAMAPQKRPPIVVTCEPRIATATIVTKKVPGRPTGAELKAMALRQQQQIDSQHQLLAAKEQRLRFLKAQEIRGAAAAAEGERLRRLRERVEAQESKLRRLRALRGQVDLQKTYNVTLSNDLDSIRALFSEKEKELSLAVAKVEALTRQLEELRRDRRGPLNLIPGSGSNGAGTNGGNGTSPASVELDKLRRELMYRNQLSLQQDARLHLQREALQQRQAELRSVDQRISELQNRLHKKKASNLVHQSAGTTLHPQPQLQQSQQNSILNNNNNNNNSIALQIITNNAPLKPSNSVYPSQRIIPRGNVAAVEPYMHTPQKTTIKSAQHTQQLKKPHQQQLIQDLTNLKLNLQQTNTNINVNHITLAESDENKLARQKLHIKQNSKDLDSETGSDISSKKNETTKFQTLPYLTKYGLSKSASSGAIPYNISSLHQHQKNNESDSDKTSESDGSTKLMNGQSHQQLTVHSTPLGTVNKSLAVPVSTTNAGTTNASVIHYSHSGKQGHEVDRPTVRPKAKHQIPSGNLVVPPRKPISSVAPTSVILAPKIVAQNPKVHMVAPNVNTTPIVSAVTSDSDRSRPALPPKPAKQMESETNGVSSVPTVVSVINKPPISEPTQENQSPTIVTQLLSDNLPIKARPLTIKKQPLSEQPKLRTMTSGIKPVQYTSRRIEMPPAFLFPEIEKGSLKDKSSSQSSNSSTVDETDKSTTSSTNGEENNHHHDVVRRTRSSLSENGKVKLARRVSFDPLALLLDASLEGELELVKKTTMQVPNPSAANDEGITALHNSICAGHFPIVKFLVEYGCDVNAQDSDGWTPLHCAASCNNLEMVKFLVESGACLFAATLSDHETPAEKCEEDEEGFDGCSEYLYSIQEKLGILNNGEVYAVFSYDAQQQDELSFDVNDRLTILRKGDDSEREWWWAKCEPGREGYVPRNLLGLYPRVPLQQQVD